MLYMILSYLLWFLSLIKAMSTRVRSYSAFHYFLVYISVFPWDRIVGLCQAYYDYTATLSATLPPNFGRKIVAIKALGTICFMQIWKEGRRSN